MSQGGSGGGWGPPGGGGGWGPPGGYPPPGGGFPPPGSPPGPPFGQPPPGGGGYGPPPGAPPPAQPPHWGPPGGFAPMPQGYPPGFNPMDGGSHWSPSDAIGFAWDRVKSDPLTIVGALAIGGILATLPGGFGTFAADSYWVAAHPGLGAEAGILDKISDPIYLGIRGLSTLINYIAQAFMVAGMTAFCLRVARGERYSFGDIFAGGQWFLPTLGINILVGLGVMLGLIFLIVPGVFLAIAWSLSLPAAIDRNLGATEAMSQSFRLTEGHRGSIFLLFLLLGGITLLGFCACFVGIFVATAMGQVAMAWVYLRLSAGRVQGQPGF